MTKRLLKPMLTLGVVSRAAERRNPSVLDSHQRRYGRRLLGRLLGEGILADQVAGQHRVVRSVTTRTVNTVTTAPVIPSSAWTAIMSQGSATGNGVGTTGENRTYHGAGAQC